jgi:hypothetical protein
MKSTIEALVSQLAQSNILENAAAIRGRRRWLAAELGDDSLRAELQAMRAELCTLVHESEQLLAAVDELLEDEDGAGDGMADA